MRNSLKVALGTLLLLPAIIGAQEQQLAPSVTIDGVVRDDKGKPLPTAEIIVGGNRRTLTNAKGEFSISEIPAGEVTFVARRIGYSPTSSVIMIDPGAVVHLAIRLVPSAVTLGTIVIEGKRYDKTLWQTGFYKREMGAAGYFFDANFMAKYHASLSGLIATVPSVRINRGPGGTNVALGSFSNGNACALEVFLDGTHIKWASTMGLDDIARPEEILGLEIYPRASEMPVVISGLGGQNKMGLVGTLRLADDGPGGVPPPSGEKYHTEETGRGYAECGAMLIWTKRMVRGGKKK